MISEALEAAEARATVHRVSDGEEALDYLRRRGRFSEAHRPDLILLDLNMPRMDGRETLAAIKSDDTLKAIPVVILTTSAAAPRSEEHTSELQSQFHRVCRLLLEKKRYSPHPTRVHRPVPASCGAPRLAPCARRPPPRHLRLQTRARL